MAKKKILLSKDGQQIHPLTRTNAVYTEDDVRLDDYLGAMVEYTQSVEQSIPTKVAEALVGIGFSLPPGTVLPYAGTEAPKGFFLCKGQELSQADYPELFSVIGFSFGRNPENENFYLPDFSGRTMFGQSDEKDMESIDFEFVGRKGGERSISLGLSHLPKHFHETNLSHDHSAYTDSSGTHNHSGSTNSSYAGSSNYFLTSSSEWEKDGGDNVSGSGDNYPKQDSGGAVNSTTTSHYHTYTTSNSGSHTHYFTTNVYEEEHQSSIVGENAPFKLLNPYITMNFIIKY